MKRWARVIALAFVLILGCAPAAGAFANETTGPDAQDAQNDVPALAAGEEAEELVNTDMPSRETPENGAPANDASANGPESNATENDAANARPPSDAPPDRENADRSEYADRDSADAEAFEPEGNDAAAVLPADPDVFHVILPATVSIVIDPFERDGRGQIYSDHYDIRNHGDADVLLTFTSMRVHFANETDFAALAAPPGDVAVSDRKAIYLRMDFGRNEIPPVVLTDPSHAAELSIPLRAAGHEGESTPSALSLSFSGQVSSETIGAEWRNGDVEISIEYRLTGLPDPKPDEEAVDVEIPDEEVPEAGTSAPEEAPGGSVASEPPEPAGEPAAPEASGPSEQPETSDPPAQSETPASEQPDQPAPTGPPIPQTE